MAALTGDNMDAGNGAGDGGSAGLMVNIGCKLFSRINSSAFKINVNATTSVRAAKAQFLANPSLATTLLVYGQEKSPDRWCLTREGERLAEESSLIDNGIVDGAIVGLDLLVQTSVGASNDIGHEGSKDRSEKAVVDDGKSVSESASTACRYDDRQRQNLANADFLHRYIATDLCGDSATLTAYRLYHVARYHKWMQDDFLQVRKVDIYP